MISKFIAVGVSLLTFLQAAQQEEPVCCGGSVKTEQPVSSDSQIKTLEALNCVKTASTGTVSPANGSTIQTTLMNQDVTVTVGATLKCAQGTPPVVDTCKFCVCWEVDKQGGGGSWSHYYSSTNVVNVDCGDMNYLYSGSTVLQAILPGTYRVVLRVAPCDGGNNCSGVDLLTKTTTFTVTM